MGTIYKQKTSKYFWIQYGKNGKTCRESTRSIDPHYAKRLLKVREGAVAEGKPPGIDAYKTRIYTLVDLYLKDYEINNRKSIKEAKHYADLISKYFGGMRAAELTSEHIRDYREKRKDEPVRVSAKRKRKDSTINRELSALRRMFRLGLEEDPPLVVRAPKIQLVKEDNVRTGFFEYDEYLALRGACPDHLKVMVTLGYWTGMRAGEILNLKWSQVDWDNDLLRLDPGTTKNKEGRSIPLMPEVKEVLFRWWKERMKDHHKFPWICHYKWGRLQSYKSAWRTACKHVGLEGKHFHDFRRSAVRNFVRAGIPQAVAREISGHKTNSVFERYNIVSRRDIDEAREKLAAYLNRKNSVDIQSSIQDPQRIEN